MPVFAVSQRWRRSSDEGRLVRMPNKTSINNCKQSFRVKRFLGSKPVPTLLPEPSPSSFESTSTSPRNASHLLRLSAEVRIMIYRFLFCKNNLRLELGSSKDRVFYLGFDEKIAITEVCRLIRNESLPILLDDLILFILWSQWYPGVSITLPMPTDWIKRIKEIQYQARLVPYLDLKHFTSLKLATVEALFRYPRDAQWPPDKDELWPYIRKITDGNNTSLFHTSSLKHGGGVEVRVQFWLLHRTDPVACCVIYNPRSREFIRVKSVWFNRKRSDFDNKMPDTWEIVKEEVWHD